jgi:mannosyltransferase OCH1-like enzyme
MSDFVTDETAHLYKKGALAHIPSEIEAKTEVITALSESSFPKVIHHIWVGPNKLPEMQRRFIENWRLLHPDWVMILWTDEHVTRDKFDLYDLIVNSPAYA